MSATKSFGYANVMREVFVCILLNLGCDQELQMFKLAFDQHELVMRVSSLGIYKQ